MKNNTTHCNDVTAHDRLTEIAAILAKGIERLKQREAKERESGAYDPKPAIKSSSRR